MQRRITMKAKKLKSGAWRCQVYIKRTDGTADRSSFTASTKKEAERQAAEYICEMQRTSVDENLTLAEACAKYIEVKSGVLSPASVNTYTGYARTRLGKLQDRRIGGITTADLQLWISDLSAEKSSKYVKNVYGLISSTLHMFIPDRHYDVRLPRKDPNTRGLPEDEDVRALMDSADPVLRKCIALAAIGTLRRGEISALKFQDIDYKNCTIRVHSDMVKDVDGHSYVYKDMPKTDQSIRTVTYPKEVIAMLGIGAPDAYVIGLNPNMITKRFDHLRDKLGIPIRFHDLRAYAASVMMTIGIPRTYIEETGGWKHGSIVLDEHYLRTFQSKKDRFAEQAAGKFKDILTTHENTHDTQESKAQS